MDMIYKFCPKCGQKYDIQTGPNLTCRACNYVFYQNSKPTISTIIINDKDEVLLGRRAIDPGKGKWDIIGGFLELGETPEQGGVREAREETGLDVSLENFIGIFIDTYGDTGYYTLNICYTAKVIGGLETPNDDIAELKWFHVSELPDEYAYQNGKVMMSELLNQFYKS